jgi:hypothetical protein
MPDPGVYQFAWPLNSSVDTSNHENNILVRRFYAQAIAASHPQINLHNWGGAFVGTSPPLQTFWFGPGAEDQIWGSVESSGYI